MPIKMITVADIDFCFQEFKGLRLVRVESEALVRSCRNLALCYAIARLVFMAVCYAILIHVIVRHRETTLQ